MQERVDCSGGGCKAGWLETPTATTAGSNSDAETYMSDCSNMSNITTASQENKYYAVKIIIMFLQQTKDIESYFPDKLLFLNSARHIVKKALSELTNQEVFRLNK